MENWHIKKGTNSKLTDFEKQYIIKNLNKKSDLSISKNLGVSRHAVIYFRTKVLGIIKPDKGSPRKKINKVIPISELNDEIIALQTFANYPSFMEGAKNRMRLLLKLRDGVTC